MRTDNESWNEVQRVLKERNSEYMSLDKLNRILYSITRGSDQLITIFIEQDRIGEIRLIRNIINTLKLCRFSIPNYQLEDEIHHVRLRIIKYSDTDITLHTQNEVKNTPEDGLEIDIDDKGIEREKMILGPLITPIHKMSAT